MGAKSKNKVLESFSVRFCRSTVNLPVELSEMLQSRYKISVQCCRKSVESVALYNIYPYRYCCLVLMGGGTVAEICGRVELSVHARQNREIRKLQIVLSQVIFKPEIELSL